MGDLSANAAAIASHFRCADSGPETPRTSFTGTVVWMQLIPFSRALGSFRLVHPCGHLWAAARKRVATWQARRT